MVEASALVAAALPEHAERLRWSRERVREHQDAAVRRLLRAASARSPWHRGRIGGCTELASVPPMGRDDLLEHFDRVVTDPRLRLAGLTRELDRPGPGPRRVAGHQVIASSGTGGRRGVYAYDAEAWATYFLSGLRWSRTTPATPAAVLVAAHPAHASRAVAETFPSPDVVALPVTLPRADLLAALTALRPRSLSGYPSVLGGLTGHAGIAPLVVRCYGETLEPGQRAELEAAWGAPVHNQWVSSEAGTLAWSCPAGTGMHVNDDLVVVEPVDEHGAPVPPGTASAKVLLTNLYNAALPLIRYEVPDSVTVRPGRCGCGSGLTWIDDVHGRVPAVFRYPGGVVVHPFVIQSVLGRVPGVADYRVRQTLGGVHVVLAGGRDSAGVAEEVRAALEGAGLGAPEVGVERVAALPPHASGKRVRFEPIA